MNVLRLAVCLFVLGFLSTGCQIEKAKKRDYAVVTPVAHCPPPAVYAAPVQQQTQTQQLTPQAQQMLTPQSMQQPQPVQPQVGTWPMPQCSPAPAPMPEPRSLPTHTDDSWRASLGWPFFTAQSKVYVQQGGRGGAPAGWQVNCPPTYDYNQQNYGGYYGTYAPGCQYGYQVQPYTYGGGGGYRYGY